MAATGSHCILEMYDCPQGILDDAELITAALREAAVEARSTLLHEVHHEFTPQGVTALALLAESHISVHTWPELGYAAADVFTCGEHTLPVKACEYLVRKLQARRFSLQHVDRGTNAPDIRPAEDLPSVAEESDRCRVRNFARITG